MSEEFDLRFGGPQTRRGGSDDSAAGNGNRTRYGYRPPVGSGYGRLLIGSRAESAPDLEYPSPLNLWRVLEILTRRWKWISLGAALFAISAFIIALSLTRYSVGVTLVRREMQNAFTGGMDPSQTKELALLTLFRVMGSPEVIHRVALNSTEYPITPGQLAKSVRISPDRDPDFVTIFISGKASKDALAYWANLYGKQVTDYMVEVQGNEAAYANQALTKRLQGIKADMAAVGAGMAEFTRNANVVDFDRVVDAFVQQVSSVDLKLDEAKINLESAQMTINFLEAELQRQGGGNEQVQAEEEKLRALLRKYTDKHVSVIQQRDYIERLKEQTAVASTNVLPAGWLPGTSIGSAIYVQLVGLRADKQRLEKQVRHFEELKEKIQGEATGLPQRNVEYGLLKSQYKSLESLRNSYEEKQRHAQMMQESALGYFRLFSAASPEQVNVRQRWMTVFLLTIVAAMIGALTAALASVIAEAVDGRIKTATDLRRISRLPLLAALGDLRGLPPSEQVTWAFRTLTILQGKLNTATDQTLVCGFISSQHGEGRSTWINLLTSAASQRGLRVLTVATHPVNAPQTEQVPAPVAGLLPVQSTTLLSTNVLMTPAQVTEQFSDPKAQPIVHIPLPGWVWNLERRKQWSIAMEQWSKIENLVLLVELPPATQPESVLLAEHLPQVIWLACSGTPSATETMHQIETLRHARVNLVGAVLNREPSSILKTRFSSWTRGLAVVGLGLSLCSARAVLPAQATADSANPCFAHPN